jgi:UDP:flavonoid glycosyltransferase YjiC (YdhE family)
MNDNLPTVDELEEIRVTGMIAPLRDKLTRLKKSLKRLLSQPKHERNTKMIKQLLKEAKSVRKIVKKFNRQEIMSSCPQCGHSYIVIRSE